MKDIVEIARKVKTSRSYGYHADSRALAEEVLRLAEKPDLKLTLLAAAAVGAFIVGGLVALAVVAVHIHEFYAWYWRAFVL